MAVPRTPCSHVCFDTVGPNEQMVLCLICAAARDPNLLRDLPDNDRPAAHLHV